MNTIIYDRARERGKKLATSKIDLYNRIWLAGTTPQKLGIHFGDKVDILWDKEKKEIIIKKS